MPGLTIRRRGGARQAMKRPLKITFGEKREMVVRVF
jgi:hypothetical protein